jgi:hypothetical protein
MISLTNVLEDITLDFKKTEYAEASALSRSFVLAKSNKVTVSLFRKDNSCELAVMIPFDVSNEMLSSLPKWKGMETKTSIMGEGAESQKYIEFHQLEGYDQSIFLCLMQNIIEELNFVEFSSSIITIKEVLKKWSVFFQFEKEYVLSANAQQGLYAELFVLEKLIQLRGANALSGWTGYNMESHDFYYGDDAIEIKSSSAKGPQKVRISNEYQLDEEGVIGTLYLMYLNMKKSEVDGETLPEIIERIMIQFDLGQKELFKEKLFKVGYIYALPELYKYHFRVREESCYDVKDGFPRITPNMLNKGIGAVEYVVSLDACSSYLIEIETFYKGVNF